MRSISRLIARSLRAERRDRDGWGNGIRWQWHLVGRVLTVPGGTSGWYHHGGYETHFYVESGRMWMECGPGGCEVDETGPGDFVHIPGGVICGDVNHADQEEAVILFRTGGGSPASNVDGPSDG